MDLTFVTAVEGRAPNVAGHRPQRLEGCFAYGDRPAYASGEKSNRDGFRARMVQQLPSLLCPQKAGSSFTRDRGATAYCESFADSRASVARAAALKPVFAAELWHDVYLLWQSNKMAT